jgi:uncharacterized membrane protein YkoI
VARGGAGAVRARRALLCALWAAAAEHTTYIRRGLGTNLLDETYGISGGAMVLLRAIAQSQARWSWVHHVVHVLCRPEEIMKTRFILMGALLVTSFATVTARAADKEEPKEKKLQQADVPRVVLDTVTRKYPTAKMTSFEQEMADGKLIYEIAIETAKGKMDVEVSPEGKIVAEESGIPPTALPAPVKASIAGSKYKTWKMKGAELVIKNEQKEEPIYEVVFTQKKEKFEVVFDKTGKITEEEAKKPKDND